MSAFGPRSFSGKRQSIAVDAGFWVAELTGFPVLETDAILDWRGTIAALEGSTNDLIIGPFDHLRAPAPSGLPPVIGGIPHSDGAFFSDGAGYSQSTIRVRLAAALDLRATSATLIVDAAGPIRKGMYFTIWAMEGGVVLPRMYIITKPPVANGNRVNIQFRPPLRTEAAAGSDVDFADPKLVMNLADPESGELDLAYGRFGRPSISLEESWNGLS